MKKRTNSPGKIKRWGFCVHCGKRYYDKKRAAYVAAAMRRERDEMVHHYKCPAHNGWHVGHPNTKEDWDRLRQRS